MDPEEFTDRSPGTLVDAAGDHKGPAYVPGKLPDIEDLELSPALLDKAMKAERKLGELSGVGRDLEDPSLLMVPYLRREALKSSKIEGTQTSMESVLEAEAGEDRETRDTQEVQNYSDALLRGLDLLQYHDQNDLDTDLLKCLHWMLFREIGGVPEPVGDFRDTQNFVGPRYTPPPPNHVSGQMEELMNYINTVQEETPEVVKIALSHYQFEAIHPFADGNGRVGRMLVVLLLDQYDILEVPLLYLSDYFDRNRQDYIYHLHRINTHGHYEQWIEFFLEAVIHQADDALERSKRLRDLHDRYTEIVDTRSRTAHNLIDLLFENPIITKPMVVDRLDVTFPTASHNVDKLRENDILSVREEGRPVIYHCEGILELTMGETPPYHI